MLRGEEIRDVFDTQTGQFCAWTRGLSGLYPDPEFSHVLQIQGTETEVPLLVREALHLHPCHLPRRGIRIPVEGQGPGTVEGLALGTEDPPPYEEI